MIYKNQAELNEALKKSRNECFILVEGDEKMGMSSLALKTSLEITKFLDRNRERLRRQLL